MIEIYNSIYSLWVALFPADLVLKYVNVFEFVTVIFVIAVVYFAILKPLIYLFKLITGGK